MEEERADGGTTHEARPPSPSHGEDRSRLPPNDGRDGDRGNDGRGEEELNGSDSDRSHAIGNRLAKAAPTDKSLKGRKPPKKPPQAAAVRASATQKRKAAKSQAASKGSTPVWDRLEKGAAAPPKNLQPARGKDTTARTAAPAEGARQSVADGPPRPKRLVALPVAADGRSGGFARQVTAEKAADIVQRGRRKRAEAGRQPPRSRRRTAPEPRL